MEQDNSQEKKDFSLNILNEEEDFRIVWASFFVFIIALIVIAFFIFKYYERYQLVQDINQDNKNILTEELIDTSSNKLQGKIYLTLSPKNSDYTGIYAYDIQKNKLIEIRVDKTSHIWGGEVFALNQKMVITNGTNILMNDLIDTQRSRVILNDSINNFKSRPVWSKEGRYVIYNTIEDISKEDNDSPEDWQIYLLNNNEEEKYLSSGAYPHITKDNMIVFLKNDGLYAMDIFGEEVLKIWEINNEVRTQIQFDISHDDHLGVISNPFTKSIYVLKNNQNNFLFEGEIVKEIKTYAFQPTFSPDDKYLAVIEPQVQEDGSFLNSKLVVYNMRTYEREEIMNLNNYKQDKILINDWGK